MKLPIRLFVYGTLCEGRSAYSDFKKRGVERLDVTCEVFDHQLWNTYNQIVVAAVSDDTTAYVCGQLFACSIEALKFADSVMGVQAVDRAVVLARYFPKRGFCGRVVEPAWMHIYNLSVAANARKIKSVLEVGDGGVCGYGAIPYC